MADTTAPVYLERIDERVVHVVMNRPERRNAITGPFADAFAATLDEVAADDNTTVVVLRGAGGAFCSGLDLKEFNADPAPSWVGGFGEKWQSVHHRLFSSNKIIIGALERAAVNGGAALALACDLLVAGESAFLQVGEIQQGMAAPMNMAWLRLRHSEALAARVSLLGDRIYGPELATLGLAYQTVPDDRVLEVVAALAERCAQHEASGVHRIKTSMRRTVVTDTAQEWFARSLAADPLAGRRLQPRAAE